MTLVAQLPAARPQHHAAAPYTKSVRRKLMLQTWMPTSLVSVWWGTRGFVCQLGRQRTVALDWKDLSLGFFQFGATQKKFRAQSRGCKAGRQKLHIAFNAGARTHTPDSWNQRLRDEHSPRNLPGCLTIAPSGQAVSASSPPVFRGRPGPSGPGGESDDPRSGLHRRCDAGAAPTICANDCRL